MATVELYSFEDSDGNEESCFTTFNIEEAKEYAKQYRLRIVANIYEFSDREVVEDYTPSQLSNCKVCGRFIDLKLGEFSPGEEPGGEGYKDDPIAPGEHDDVCAKCNYGPEVETSGSTEDWE